MSAYGRSFVISGLVVLLWCTRLPICSGSRLPRYEVDALGDMAASLGSKYWQFNDESCTVLKVGMTPDMPVNSNCSFVCQCDFPDDTDCHVVTIVLKGFSLPGVLPPQLVKFPYLKEIDFCYNLLTGSIPEEWGSTRLTSISILVNRFSGRIPAVLANITSLTYLCLEANNFSGPIPPELGRLINLQTLLLSSNQLTGILPLTFSALVNMTDFRINDNSLKGTVPLFIQNWRQLQRLELHASGLHGPIPPQISSLDQMNQLRISDMNGPRQQFPLLQNMTVLTKLVLRSCNLHGEIPPYIWTMTTLEMLDLSYNELSGQIPSALNLKGIRFIFLTGNQLSGSIPDTLLKSGTAIDLSYNNFSWQSPDAAVCQQNMNLNLNLYRSSATENYLPRRLHCIKNFHCPHYSSCLHVNCGGNDITVVENGRKISYKGDVDVAGGSATSFLSNDTYWGLSSTGDYMDDNDKQDLRYTQKASSSSNLSGLYETARAAPISLTYFHYCLENGMYTVKLHFAEILFMNGSTFSSLGRRMFDIYLQDERVQEDFNIEVVAGGAQIPKIQLYNVSVTKNSMDIRLQFAGKGTTRIPKRGVYGPIISAVSVSSVDRGCSNARKRATGYIIGGVVASIVLFALLAHVWWRHCFRRKLDLKGTRPRGTRTEGIDLQTDTFTFKQIEAATNNFDPANKIGEGGFGPVYKGNLSDGTAIAVKQLSSKSQQGDHEFLNEMGMISCLQHPNLVKLHGCCIEGDQLLLVYEYMENNSLARALFGPEDCRLQLDWPARHNICIGIAKGLAFLHEESRLKIVHRDIKATNVLLDKDLNPKISDFGLARLNEEKTHITTKIAGTIGYMAPEYALWGFLTQKADVYSFGVMALEIVSGKSNCDYTSDDYVCLMHWACRLQQSGNINELIDEKLKNPKLNEQEAEVIMKVALQCTNVTPSLRPTMSEVVNMFLGKTNVPEVKPDPSIYHNDLRFKAARDFQKHPTNSCSSEIVTRDSMSTHTIGSSSTSTRDFHEITPQIDETPLNPSDIESLDA
ncbi:hypothetical protein MLD38_019279 [Melastoma candidum]|uniref:Uncharacterized protein n=1 Tax=Melastoma candidum TaxID=119954 RepID=A0ACB9R0J4_9MYRT|nr:hypothetical protein MLD38_019279 [Melastoma candidum]